MSPDTVHVISSGEIFPKTGVNTRSPYAHQKQAMECLDRMDSAPAYSTLVVLPTGGGKTYTAAVWLLKNAVDRKKKILWIAHRQMLLDQAAESFQSYAYAELIPHISSFRFRIVSGSTTHDRTVDIRPADRLLIVSKDSLGRNPACLDGWLRGERELYLIVDEAHHSTAKTYRRIIDYVRARVPHVKLIGLTATPFRTAADEQGLLARIYSDGLRDGKPIHGDVGIAYQIGLKELINRRILAKPSFVSRYTEESYGEDLGLDAWESIQRLDVLPNELAEQLAVSAARNKLIVSTYLEKRKEYGQTIVFAVNINHAITLSALFNKAGVRADYIISSVKDLATGASLSREENERKLRAYRDGKLEVLVNVNILTEGVDLPQTRSVFLARPTVSTILMTQMVGRALRGPAAGGTADAYIVSFIDRWNEHIAWVNPESLFEGGNDFTETASERARREVRLISIAKLEEFARILDDTVDTSALEAVPFERRIPLGMYAFSYLEENGMDLSWQVMVYDSTAEAYRKLMEALPGLFRDFGVTEEYPPEAKLHEMEARCRNSFFRGEMIPSYESRDVISVLRYYAQYEAAPSFYSFDEIDRSRLDLGAIARRIWDADMGQRAKSEYINALWDGGDDDLLRLFFGRKLYFVKQLDIELMKLADPEAYADSRNVKYDSKALEDLPIHVIRQVDPALAEKLTNGAFERARTADGAYRCARCGMRSGERRLFQVDHIVPMYRGGKSVPENLQLLCRRCNGIKGVQ